MTDKTTADVIVEAKNAGLPGELAVQAKLATIASLNSNAKAQIIALTSLTGSVGTANTAMTALAASTAALTGADTATLPTKASIDAIITAINNNLADLQASNNAIIAALKA